MDAPKLNASREVTGITLRAVKLRIDINKGTIFGEDLVQELCFIKNELEVLAGILENEDDKKRLKPLVDVAHAAIEGRMYANFKNIADDHLLELQSCLVAMQEILIQRERDVMFDSYEPKNSRRLSE